MNGSVSGVRVERQREPSGNAKAIAYHAFEKAEGNYMDGLDAALRAAYEADEVVPRASLSLLTEALERGDEAAEDAREVEQFRRNMLRGGSGGR